MQTTKNEITGTVESSHIFLSIMDSINQFPHMTCDLNTKFNHRCQSDWSELNLISFVSQDGIYILRPQPENRNGPFEVQLIRNPTSKFSHVLAANDLGPTFDKKWSTLDNNQYMQVFLDPALATHVSNMSSELYPRRYRMAKWSPIVQNFPKECILAALTTDYQLLVFARKNATWMMADLSSEFDAHPLRTYGGDKSFDSVRSKLHSLSFCNICWQKRGDDSISLLASTILGDIIVWRLVFSQQKSEKPSYYRYSFVIQAILSTHTEYITSMQLEDNLLIAACRNGQVVLYDLSSHLTGCNQQAVFPIILDPTAILWPEDNIEVNDLYMKRTRDHTSHIVLSKSTNICWCTMTYVKNTQENHATLTINDSFSAVDVSSPATWLRPAGHNRAVFIAEDGSFFQIEFPEDHLDGTPDFETVRTGRVDLSRMVPRGLCTSSRGKLIALISSISLLFDPCKIVAPTKLIIVPTNNESLMDCLRKLLNEDWLISENVKSTMDVQDSIDYIRSVFPNLDHNQFHDMHKTIKEAFMSIDHPKNDSQLIKLKILAFLMMKLSSSSEHNLDMEYKKLDLDFFNHVLTCYVRKVLSALSQRPADLTQDQVNSLRNYNSWLKTVPFGKQVLEGYCQQFKTLESGKYSGVTGEHCSICRTTISFEQSKYGICASGHRFARCARSLLIVDLQKGDKLFCEHCKRHYLAYLVWPMPANLWPCIYCQ